jgi:hypothetical protein
MTPTPAPSVILPGFYFFVYTLLMKGRVPRATFFENLMVTNWYPDTINRYFAGDCQTVFDKVITDFNRRGIIGKVGEDWVTTVKP